MFNPKLYSRKYYNRHLVQYREWENAIGKNIVETLNVLSVLDVGCGVGSYLEGALQAGCTDILGIEILFDVAKEFFTEEIAPYLIFGDATQPLLIFPSCFHCVMSFEVGEHIEPSGTDMFIENLTQLSNAYIILTVAPPGQGGTGHINLRPKQFWIDSIQAKGFTYQPDLVDTFVNTWTNYNTPEYILKNLMVFKK